MRKTFGCVRFLCNQMLSERKTAILAFFRDHGYMGIVQEKDKAIKLLKLISAFPKAETFAKRFQEHFQHNFMAK